MKFPIIDITRRDWGFRVDAPIHFDKFVYSKSFGDSKERLRDHFFCDSEGKVYQVVEIIPTTKAWRRILGLFINVYKSELVFEQKDRTLSVDELREFMIDCIKRTRNQKAYDYWVDDLRMAYNHHQLLGGSRR